ncbi:hypothetical protein AAVH_29907 [Aphelenchoides avenae]|nr:hypothetical protein AAVH_29907 [Aphelenchus avenae]
MSSSGSGAAKASRAKPEWMLYAEADDVLSSSTSSAADRAAAIAFLASRGVRVRDSVAAAALVPAPAPASAPVPVAPVVGLLDADVMVRYGFLSKLEVDSSEVLSYMPSVLAGAIAAFDPPPVADLPSGSDGLVKPVALEGTQPKLYKCPYCTMTSDRSWNVKEHYPHCPNYSGHPSTLPEFICEHCEKVFTGSGALRNHVNGTGKGTRCRVLKEKEKQGAENEEAETESDDDDSEQ